MVGKVTDINNIRIHLLRASRMSQLKRGKSREGVEKREAWEVKIKGEKARRGGQRVVSRMATLFTVFAIVKAANIYVVFKRTRVLGVTRVLSASEETSRIVGKLIPQRFADDQ